MHGMDGTHELKKLIELCHKHSMDANELEKLIELLHKHGMDAHKLEKLIDQSVNQADSIIKYYDDTNKIPAQLAKAFLNGIFAGTVAHLNETKQRKLQLPPLQQLLDNAGYGNGQTPDHFIDDGYLGEDNGIRSRHAGIAKRKDKAKKDLKETQDILPKCAPSILESVADSIKTTSVKYTKLFRGLDKDVMGEVSKVVKKLTEECDSAAKTSQPESKRYLDLFLKDPTHPLFDPKHPLFMIPLLKDAQNAKIRLDEFVKDMAKGVSKVELKFAPLKSVERAMVKVYEKYECRFDMLTDIARATVVCEDEDTLKTILTKLETAVAKNETRISRIKFRLDEGYDALEAGGYRDILVNMAFPPRDIIVDNWHIVELQLNLKEFVKIKDGGGHASYAVGRILQAFDPAAVTYTGIANSDRARDMQSGLIKKATLVGVDVPESEVRIVEALGSTSVQLVELKLLNIKFSSALGNLDWLVASAEHLATTLQVLQINSCDLECSIPAHVGLLSQLVVLNLMSNKLTGTPSLSPHHSSP